MAGLTSGFTGFSNIALWTKYAIFFGLFLLFCLFITGIVILILVKLKQIKVYEITNNNRLKIYSGGYKKRKGSSIMQFYSRKIKRNLAQFQQNDIYTKGKQDAVFLMKDNNGLYHTLRLPTYKQIKQWYKVQYNVDLDEVKQLNKKQTLVRSIYFEPTPHENIDWLANQLVEAETEFKDLEWWQHPNVLFGMSVAAAVFLQIMNFMFIYLMRK